MNHPNKCQHSKEQDHQRGTGYDLTRLAPIGQMKIGIYSFDFPVWGGKPGKDQPAQKSAYMPPIVDARKGKT